MRFCIPIDSSWRLKAARPMRTPKNVPKIPMVNTNPAMEFALYLDFIPPNSGRVKATKAIRYPKYSEYGWRNCNI